MFSNTHTWISLMTVSFLLVCCDGANEWCSEKYNCQINGVVVKHTMCAHAPRNDHNSSTGVTVESDESSKKFLLKAHNAFRNILSTGWTGLPEASNIRQMTWDITLEELATNWAMQCNTGHDSCRKTQEFEEVGQNIGTRPYVNKSVASSVFEEWKDSLVGRKFESPIESIIQSFKDGLWNNGSQLTWAETTKMGCGEAYCHKNQTNHTVIVCNYGPAGNLKNREIYNIGDPCTNCSQGTQCRTGSSYPNLCALASDPLDDSLAIPNPSTENQTTVKTTPEREKETTAEAKGKVTKQDEDKIENVSRRTTNEERSKTRTTQREQKTTKEAKTVEQTSIKIEVNTSTTTPKLTEPNQQLEDIVEPTVPMGPNKKYIQSYAADQRLHNHHAILYLMYGVTELRHLIWNNKFVV